MGRAGKGSLPCLDLFVGTHFLAGEMSRDLSSSNMPPPALFGVSPHRWSSQLAFTVESDACKQSLENCSPAFPRVAMGMKDAFLARFLVFPGLYFLMHLRHIFPLQPFPVLNFLRLYMVDNSSLPHLSPTSCCRLESSERAGR